MNNDNRFSHGFLLGLIIGGAAVFLLGTKTGRNILKILSEQGLDGIANLLEEYDFASVEEEEENSTMHEDESTKDIKTNGQVRNSFKKQEGVSTESEGKKRFFKRIRK